MRRSSPVGKVARTLASLVVLAHVLAAVALGQLSGASRLFGELISFVASAAAEPYEDCARACPHCDGPSAPSNDPPCPSDGPCDDCPPGCPNCHCPSAPRSVAPPADFILARALPVLGAAAPSNEAATPQIPDLPSLYRPPRNQSSAS